MPSAYKQKKSARKSAWFDYVKRCSSKLNYSKDYNLDYYSLCDYISVMNMLGCKCVSVSKRTYSKILEYALLDKCCFSIVVFSNDSLPTCTISNVVPVLGCSI